MIRVIIWILVIGIIIPIIIIKFKNAKKVIDFGMALPDDCFLVVSNTPEYRDTILCYYVQHVRRVTGLIVEFNGCITDINNPKAKSEEVSYSKLRIPTSWILEKSIDIRCFDTEALKAYVNDLKRKN